MDLTGFIQLQVVEHVDRYERLTVLHQHQMTYPENLTYLL